MLFKNAEGQDACPLRAVNRFDEIGAGEFFPMNGELRLCLGR
jgi:hypothetical protein